MGAGDSFGITFGLLIFVLCEEGTANEERINLDSDTLDFMLPQRTTAINYFYSPFTPYSDMRDMVLRASEFGFPSSLKRAGALPDSIVFKDVPYYEECKVKGTIEFRIDELVKTVLLTAKAVTRRNPPPDSNPKTSLFDLYMASMRPIGFSTYVFPQRLRITRYKKLPLSRQYSTLRAAMLTEPFFHALQHSAESLQPPPLGLLVMQAWTLLFWVTISELNNFYTGSRESYSIIEVAPVNLDDLSATFIFHVCKIMREDKDILPTDIPTGFCPNPCAVQPCLRVRNAIGEECFHTGQGLFISDFRCKCLPGFEWVPALGSSELGSSTPLTDEVGSCEPVDVCSSYCNLLGTRRCDVIPGTGNAICLCKHHAAALVKADAPDEEGGEKELIEIFDGGFEERDTWIFLRCYEVYDVNQDSCPYVCSRVGLNHLGFCACPSVSVLPSESCICARLYQLSQLAESEIKDHKNLIIMQFTSPYGIGFIIKDSNFYLAINMEMMVVLYHTTVNVDNAEPRQWRKGLPSMGTAGMSALILAAWNVHSLLDNPGINRPERGTALIARELEHYKVDIAALSETWFSEQCQLEEVGAGYTFFWRLEDLPAADLNISMETRWCQLRQDVIHSTVLAVLGSARVQNLNWFDDNDGYINQLLAAKNRLHRAHLDRPTGANKAAFYQCRPLCAATTARNTGRLDGSKGQDDPEICEPQRINELLH
ncbi:hypothetical protein SprV_0401473800 [Sparganum proliferum]